MMYNFPNDNFYLQNCNLFYKIYLSGYFWVQSPTEWSYSTIYLYKLTYQCCVCHYIIIQRDIDMSAWKTLCFEY